MLWIFWLKFCSIDSSYQERHESDFVLQGQIGTLELELIFLIYIVQQDLVTIKPSLKYIWTDGVQPGTSESWVISHSLHFLRKWNDLTYNFQVLWTFTPNDAGYLLLQLHFQTRLQFPGRTVLTVSHPNIHSYAAMLLNFSSLPGTSSLEVS